MPLAVPSPTQMLILLRLSPAQMLILLRLFKTTDNLLSNCSYGVVLFRGMIWLCKRLYREKLRTIVCVEHEKASFRNLLKLG